MPFAAALSTHPLASEAAGEVIGQLMEANGPSPDLAVLFVSPPHRAAMGELAAAVRAVLRPVTLLGASAVAVIGGAQEAEDAPAVSIWAAWGLPSVTPVRLELQRGLDGPRLDGLDALAGVGSNAEGAGRALIVVPDPFTFPAEAFLDHVASRCPDLTVIGGLASAATAPGGNVLVLDGSTYRTGAVGVIVEAEVETVVSQGCRPVGMPFTVTRASGSTVAELAGRPALQRLGELVEACSEHERELLAHGVHLGRVVDEHKVDHRQGDFLVRGVLGGDRRSGTIEVNDEVSVGDTVQFQLRDAASADEDLRELLAGRTADGALVFTCNGRGRHLFDVDHHDASVVVESIGSTAVGGMFCAGELGPVGRRSYLHGFTASVALFRDPEGNAHDRHR